MKKTRIALAAAAGAMAAIPFGGCTAESALPAPPDPVPLTRKAPGLREIPVFDVEHPQGRLMENGRAIVYDMPNYIMGTKRVCQLRFPWGGLDEFVQRSLVGVHCPDKHGFSLVFNRDDCFPIDEKDFKKWGIDRKYAYEVDEKTESVRYRQPYVSRKTRTLKYLAFTMRKTGKPGEVEIVWDGGGDEIGLIISCQNDYRTWKSMTIGGEKFRASSDTDVATGKPHAIRKAKDGSWFMGEDMEKSAKVTGLPSGQATIVEGARDLIKGNTLRTLQIFTARALSGRIVIDMGESPRQEQNANKFPPVNGLDFSLFNGIHYPLPATRNELRNPGFEEGFYHWTYIDGQADGHSGYEIVENGGPDGSRALLFKTKTGRDTAAHLRTPMLYSMPMQLIAGEKYTLSFYVKRASDPVRKGRKVEAVVSLGSNCRNASIPGNAHHGDVGHNARAYFVATDEWRRHSRTFTAGNGGFRVVLGAVEGDVMFDKLQLERGETATEYATAPVEAVIVSAKADNQLASGEPKRLGVRLAGKPGTLAKVKVTISNYYRETVHEEEFEAEIGSDGKTVRPLDPATEKIGNGVFPVRIDAEADGVKSTAYQRFSVMPPLPDTSRATAKLIGTLISPTRYGNPATLAKKLREWGVGSLSWGGLSRRSAPKKDFEYLYAEGIVNVQHAAGNDLLRSGLVDKGLFPGREAAYKIPDICREFCKEPLTDAQATELTRAMTEYLKDADPRSSMALSWWNEEEGGPGLVRDERYEDYFRYQRVMVDAIRADGNRFKTTYSSGMSSILDYKLPILESYLTTAAKHGVKYDVMTFHAYGHLDGGRLGFFDLDEQVGKVVKIMERCGYGNDTEIISIPSSV